MFSAAKQNRNFLVLVCVCARACAHSVVSNSLQTHRPPQTAVCHALLLMEFFRQEYWRGVPFPPPGDLPDPEIELASLTPPALARGFSTTAAPWEAQNEHILKKRVFFLKSLVLSGLPWWDIIFIR